MHRRAVLPEQLLHTWSYSPRHGAPPPTPTRTSTTYVSCDTGIDSARAKEDDYRKSPHAVFPFKTMAVDTPSRGGQKRPIHFKGQLVPPPERSPGPSPPASWRVSGTPLSWRRAPGDERQRDQGQGEGLGEGEGEGLGVGAQQQLADWHPLPPPPGGRSPRAPLALWP